MSFTQRLTPRTWYWFLAIIWLVLSVHVSYLYISFSGDEKTDKGGTFIEAIDSKANYLPYTSTNDNDKFYQSLLFQGCVYPTIEGTNITYRDELCSVSTENYQRFSVTTVDDKFWSDGTAVTLNDILFTYETILKNNYRNIGSLDAYRNITVRGDEESNEIIVTFPNPSIDNMIFFTNFILPSHLLANQTLEHYISTFYSKPINNTCITLQPQKRDITSTVFDLSNCSQTLLKYYQTKSFESQEAINEYVESNPDRIDLVISDKNLPGYDANKVILNKYVTYFFNTQKPRLTPTLRKQIGGILQAAYQSIDSSNHIAPDPFLFPELPTVNASQVFSGKKLGEGEVIEQKPNKIEIPDLKTNLVWGGSKPEEQEYSLQKTIRDKVSLQFSFSEGFDKISVTLNEGVEYFPSTYNKVTQSSLYNLNPVFRNIVQGRNVYTIKGYKEGLHTDTYRLIIYYLSEPEYPAAETVIQGDSFDPIQVIYYTDPISQKLIDRLKRSLDESDTLHFFNFEGFGDANTFEGKLTSQDYDLVLRSINMGLRKDLSNLFTSSVSTINPSLYTNEELANLINRFFLAGDDQRDGIKQRIDEIYMQDIPLIIIGKELGTIHIREVLSFPYPQRLYVLGRRRDFINNIDIFKHISIDWDRVFKIRNFFSFLGQYW